MLAAKKKIAMAKEWCKTDCETLQELHIRRWKMACEKGLYDQRIRDNMERKLKENDWLLPIIIAANGDVIEGHHRIESAKLLGETTVPVYVVDWVNTNNAKEHLKCIINLNNGNKAWTSLDYLKAFARDNKDYRKVYNSYLKNSNNISVGNIINCYFG